MLSNCGVGEDSWEFLGLQEDPTSPSKGNQSLIFIGKLKLQYFGHLMPRADSLEKTLMLGKIFEGRKRGWQRMRWLDGQLNELECKQTLGDGVGQESLACCSPWGCRGSQDWATEQQQWRGGLFQLFQGRGGDFRKLGHHPLLAFSVSLRSVLVLVGVSFSSCITMGV